MGWIYVPDQVSEAQHLKHSDCAEQSATSNGMTTANDCSSKEWQMAGLTMHPCGMTSKHSTGNPGVDLWISCLEEYRANLIASQEKNKGQKMNEIYGTLTKEFYAKFNHPSPSSKIAPKSLRQTLPENLENLDTKYNPLWWPLLIAGLGMNANGRGSLHVWETCPDCEDVWCNIHGKHVYDCTCPNVEEWGENWPYTMEMPYRLPTLTAQDAKNNGGPAQYRRHTLPMNVLVGGPMNPEFAEWFMGWPIGWTELKSLAMDGFPRWQQSLRDASKNYFSNQPLEEYKGE